MKRRILLIDFERRSSQATQALLQQEGFDVCAAQTGAEIDERLKAGGLDLVILEPMIPGQDGFKLCQRIKRGERGAGPTVIVASRIYRGQRYRTMAKEHGADCYLERPQQDGLLVTMVHRLLPVVADVPAPAAVAEPALEAMAEQPYEEEAHVSSGYVARRSGSLSAVLDRPPAAQSTVTTAASPAQPAWASAGVQPPIAGLDPDEAGVIKSQIQLDCLSDNEIEDALARVLGTGLDDAWNVGPSPTLSGDDPHDFSFGEADSGTLGPFAELLNERVELPDDPDVVAAAEATAELSSEEIREAVQPVVAEHPLTFGSWSDLGLGPEFADVELEAAFERLAGPAEPAAPAVADEPIALGAGPEPEPELAPEVPADLGSDPFGDDPYGGAPFEPGFHPAAFAPEEPAPDAVEAVAFADVSAFAPVSELAAALAAPPHDEFPAPEPQPADTANDVPAFDWHAAVAHDAAVVEDPADDAPFDVVFEDLTPPGVDGGLDYTPHDDAPMNFAAPVPDSIEQIELPEGLGATLDRLEHDVPAFDAHTLDAPAGYDDLPMHEFSGPTMAGLESLEALDAGLARISQTLQAVRSDEELAQAAAMTPAEPAPAMDDLSFEAGSSLFAGPNDRADDPRPEPSPIDVRSSRVTGPVEKTPVFARPDELLDDISAAFSREIPPDLVAVAAPPHEDKDAPSWSGFAPALSAETPTEPAVAPHTFDAGRVRQRFSASGLGGAFHSRFTALTEMTAADHKPPEPSPPPESPPPAHVTSPAQIESEVDRVFAGFSGNAPEASPEAPDSMSAAEHDDAEAEVPEGLRGMDAGTAELLSSLEELESSMPEAPRNFLSGDSGWTGTTGFGDLAGALEQELQPSVPLSPPAPTAQDRSFEEMIFKVQATEPPAPVYVPLDPALEIEPLAGPNHGPEATGATGASPTTGRRRQTAPSAPAPAARPLFGWLLSGFAIAVVLVGVGSGLFLKRGATAPPLPSPVPAAVPERPIPVPHRVVPIASAGSRPSTAVARAVPPAPAPAATPAPSPAQAPVLERPRPALASDIRPAEQATIDAPAPRPPATPAAAVAEPRPASSQDRPAPVPASRIEATPGPFPLARPSELDDPVRLLSAPVPELPAEAVTNGVTNGRVYLNVLVGADGLVKEARVMIDPGHGLGPAAREAVLGWHYAMPRRSGQPVRVWKGEVVEFGRPADAR